MSSPITPQPSKIDFLLLILQVVARTLATSLPGAAGQGANLADSFLEIAQHAHAGYEAEVGAPIDPSLLKPYAQIVQEASGTSAGGEPA